MLSVEFSMSRAIGLTEASHRMRGRGGRPPVVETVRRWANPRCGCFPAGKTGPQLILRTRKVNGEVLTMPEWVDAFERERARLGERQAEEETSLRTTKQRDRELARADRQLDEQGVR